MNDIFHHSRCLGENLRKAASEMLFESSSVNRLLAMLQDLTAGEEHLDVSVFEYVVRRKAFCQICMELGNSGRQEFAIRSILEDSSCLYKTSALLHVAAFLEGFVGLKSNSLMQDISSVEARVGRPYNASFQSTLGLSSLFEKALRKALRLGMISGDQPMPSASKSSKSRISGDIYVLRSEEGRVLAKLNIRDE